MGNSSSLPLRSRRRHRIVLTSNPHEALPPPEMQYLKPNGLYPTCQWDPKTVRRLILRHELAPRHPGIDDPTDSVREECPICMLVYPVLNETRCCHARLCTECYLQIRPPRHNREPCPFCKYKRVEASYKGPRDKHDIEREELEEKKAADAMKRANLAAAAAAAAAEATSSTVTCSPTSTSPPSSRSPLSANSPHTTPSLTSPVSSATSSASPSSSLYTAQDTAASTSDAYACPSNRSGAAPLDEFTSRYYHDKAPAIDPLLLEAMASEVTYASPAGSASDRASASSSGRLDMHMRELHADRPCESDQESMSCIAEVGHRVIRLPWHGADVDRSAVVVQLESGSSSDAQDELSEEEGLQQEEKLSLREAIRRSLIEM